jgi:hypothetical protein
MGDDLLLWKFFLKLFLQAFKILLLLTFLFLFLKINWESTTLIQFDSRYLSKKSTYLPFSFQERPIWCLFGWLDFVLAKVGSGAWELEVHAHFGLLWWWVCGIHPYPCRMPMWVSNWLQKKVKIETSSYKLQESEERTKMNPHKAFNYTYYWLVCTMECAW